MKGADEIGRPTPRAAAQGIRFQVFVASTSCGPSPDQSLAPLVGVGRYAAGQLPDVTMAVQASDFFESLLFGKKAPAKNASTAMGTKS